MTHKILTANALRSGGVVFLTAEGKWSPFISEAQLSNSDEVANNLEATGQQDVGKQIIVEPFLLDVSIKNGIPHPVRFREQLRVLGPSVRTEFTKPTLKEVA